MTAMMYIITQMFHINILCQVWNNKSRKLTNQGIYLKPWKLASINKSTLTVNCLLAKKSYIKGNTLHSQSVCRKQANPITFLMTIHRMSYFRTMYRVLWRKHNWHRKFSTTIYSGKCKKNMMCSLYVLWSKTLCKNFKYLTKEKRS